MFIYLIMLSTLVHLLYQNRNLLGWKSIFLSSRSIDYSTIVSLLCFLLYIKYVGELENSLLFVSLSLCFRSSRSVALWSWGPETSVCFIPSVCQSLLIQVWLHYLPSVSMHLPKRSWLLKGVLAQHISVVSVQVYGALQHPRCRSITPLR